jgi:hypothetical protein
MKRSTVAAAALMMVGMMGERLEAQTLPIPPTVEWVGGVSGEWNTGNVWRNTTTNVTGDAATIFGQTNGSDGANSTDPNATRARNIVIPAGSTVEYDRTISNSDFRIRQGSSLTIGPGAVWVQATDATYSENGWTQMDPSNLILDGGAFRRTGESPAGDGGGIVLFGSYRSGSNFGVLPPPAVINVLLTNGGEIDNTGQVWFGAEEEHADDGMTVSWEVNNGSIDLTGGDTAANSNGGDWGDVFANLAFWYGIDLGEASGGADGDGLPKNENYEINFTGPGTMTVDTINGPAPTAYADNPSKPAVHGSGIRIYRQDAITGIWTETKASYEDLWNAGILKSKGMSGIETFPGSGIPSTPFANHFTVTGDPDSDNYTLTRKNPTLATWDGGTGVWSTDAKWNGGQTASAVLGQNNGTSGGEAIVLDGSAPGGAAVTYDPNANGDFRVGVGDGVSSLTIKNGASLSMESASDIDGKWTRYEGDLILDGGTFRRTKDNVNSLNGGLMMLGAFAQRRGMEIDVTLTNGGRLENDGQLWFGSPSPGGNAAGLEVSVTINDGSIDLTGGDANAATAAPETLLSVLFSKNPDLVFTNLFRNTDDNTRGPAGPAGEKYAINFTGPGSITVDHSGIVVVTENDDSGTNFTVNDATYQELWDLGILQANGMSGLTGSTFGDFFTTTGTLGMDNYTLTSLLTGPGLAGDFDSDNDVDGNDFLVWQRGVGGTHNAATLATWKANFGSTGSVPAVGAVPEPGTAGLACLAIGSVALVRRRR